MWKEKRAVVENFLDRNKLFVLTAHSWPPCGRDNDNDFDDENSIYDDHVDLAKCRLPWANLRMRYIYWHKHFCKCSDFVLLGIKNCKTHFNLSISPRSNIQYNFKPDMHNFEFEYINKFIVAAIKTNITWIKFCDLTKYNRKHCQRHCSPRRWLLWLFLHLLHIL